MRLVYCTNRAVAGARASPVYGTHGYAAQRTFFSLPKLPGVSGSVQKYTYKKKLNFPATSLFTIVSDVDRYKEFVPFVLESFVSKRNEQSLPVEAGIRVGWQQFDEKFTCKVVSEPNTRLTAESLTTSLFESLYTEWKFNEVKNPRGVSNTCEIELNLSYQFKNPLYNTVSSLFSEQVAQIMIKAFEDRAKDLHRREMLKDRVAGGRQNL